jgi:hypothetical protein
MGLTCASLHVYSADSSSSGSGVEVRSLVQAAGSRLGYELVDNADEAERRLDAVAVPEWISFFDMTNPPVITEESVDLGKQLSAASGCPVLITAVVDSDAFAFLLFEKGRQVDAHASMPGLLPGRMKKWPPPKRATEWSRLFNRPVGVDAVEALAEKGVLFADDLLLRLCELVGLSGELATQTPDDVEARPWPNQKRFHLRSCAGPAGSSRVKQTVPNKDRTQQLTIGLWKETFIPFELRGPAGAFIDPVLEFTGPAADSAIVELSGGYGLWTLGIEAIRRGDIRRVNAEVCRVEADGRRVLRTCLKGLSPERFAFPLRKQSILIYWSTLRGVASGAGELRVSCLPNGSAVERLELRPQFLVEV